MISKKIFLNDYTTFEGYTNVSVLQQMSWKSWMKMQERLMSVFTGFTHEVSESK